MLCGGVLGTRVGTFWPPVLWTTLVRSGMSTGTLDKLIPLIKGVVSKETVVLCRWGSCIQKFGFINGVDNVN